jgi:hypothetical protein
VNGRNRNARQIGFSTLRYDWRFTSRFALSGHRSNRGAFAARFHRGSRSRRRTEEAADTTGSRSVSLEEGPASVIQASRNRRGDARELAASLSAKRRSARLKRRAVLPKDNIENATEKAIDVREIGRQ